MPAAIDLTGKKFGWLTVLRRAKPNFWLCQCRCGAIKAIRAYDFKRGPTKSCGCKRAVHNGLSVRFSAEYKIWNCMISRCTNPRNKDYRLYGARGIRVVKRWLSFKNFLDDMGSRPANCASLDRKNNNGRYCKSNCRWTDWVTQSTNTRQNRLFTFRGKRQCLSQWAKEFNLPYPTLYDRVMIGKWSLKKALTQKRRGVA